MRKDRGQPAGGNRQKAGDGLRPPHGPVALMITVGVIAAAGYFFSPAPALADPHAVFYTDAGQRQVFFNVLAALNQADYVEPPSQPPIDADQRLSSFIRSGKYASSSNQPQYQTTRDQSGQVQIERTSGDPLEPNEVTGDTRLPRLRVRQVTSDDGDVYFRQRVAERALAEAQRVEISNLLCGFRRLYLGTEGARECTAQQRQNGLF